VGAAVTEARPDPDPADWTDPAPVYDEVAASYAERFLTELSRKPFDCDLLDRFAAAVQHRATAEHPVCDLGCGPGHIGAYLAGHGIPVVGIDLSAGMVAEGRRAFPSIAFSQGDMTALDQPDGAFTAIDCFYAIIHLPRARVPQALAEMRRTLVAGGELLLSTHGGEGSLHADRYFEYEVSLYATLFSLTELTGLVEAAGLAVREAHERAPYEDELATPRLYVWATAPGA
jgi:SAM-dependent methyltransferase